MGPNKIAFSDSVKKSLVKGLRSTLTLVAVGILTAAGSVMMDSTAMLSAWADVPMGAILIVPALNLLGQALVDFARHADDRS